MASAKIVVLFAIVAASVSAEELVFPTTLKFGVATAAYQVEGAWNVSDKGFSVWDTHVHIPGKVADGRTGDIACDSYHKWQRDIEMVEELGADYYRFSISWPRLLPTGFPNKISEDGKNYYNKLIDGLLEKGIEPVVTVFHWDLPQTLQDLGGWANPLISDWFANYARVVFSLFGDRVKTWITINEPFSICDGSYSLGMLAPGIISPDEVGTYLCNKHVMIAHAKAWRIYDQEFRSKFHGEVSYSNNLLWYEKLTAADEELAELSLQHCAGRYSHPVFSKEGGWPPTIEKIVAENSAKQGYNTSRLPPFTQEEIELVKGTYDFYGVNYYTTRYVTAKGDKPTGAFPFEGSEELGVVFSYDPSWKVSCNGWLAPYPPGLRKYLNWLKRQYGDVKFLITENGYGTCGEDDLHLEDQDRVEYYTEHLRELHKAITIDGVNVGAFTFWSLMDNFEWMDGFGTKFGIYAVDFNDPERTRIPRQSAKLFSKIVKSRKLVPSTGPVKYNTELYLWYSFVGVSVFMVIVLVLFLCMRRNREENMVETAIPLVK